MGIPPYVRGLAFLFALAAGPTSGFGQPACGGPDTPCSVANGKYYAALPETASGSKVVLWLHGYGRSGKSFVSKPSRTKPFTERGYAVIAPNGQPDIAAPKNLDWGVNDGHEWPRDDVEFLRNVLSDAVGRFEVDGSQVLVAGFSRGGSMVWDLACKAPETASAFAAVAGAFWEPMFEDCTGPAHVFHTHGFSDRLVPLEGREVRFHGLDFVQGNVFKAIEVWRRVNGCRSSADVHSTKGPNWRKAWTKCETGSITLDLSPRSHGIPKGWGAYAIDWFESLPR